MSSFRFAARYALLTYSQCGDLDPFDVVCHLASLGAECIVGREDHADGGVHLHAFTDFGRKFQSRNCRVFDVGGHHPNVSPSQGTPEEGWDYAIKDGDVVGGGLERPGGSRVSPSGSKWAYIIAAESRDEFFDRVASMDPRALCVSFGNLRTYADWRYRVDPAPYRNPANIGFDTSGFPELDQWVRENLGGTEPGEFILHPRLTSVGGRPLA